MSCRHSKLLNETFLTNVQQFTLFIIIIIIIKDIYIAQVRKGHKWAISTDTAPSRVPLQYLSFSYLCYKLQCFTSFI